MAFNTYEEGQETSAPIELYTITIGTVVYRYTSAEDDITEDSSVFTAIPISRGVLKGGGPDTRKENLILTVPGDNAVAKQYINSVPGTSASVTIERIQRSDGPTFEVITIFNGRIASVAFQKAGREAQLKVEPLVTAQSRPLPNHTYQALCNHVLYDDLCGVDDTSASFRLTGAVTAVSGITITVTGADASGDGYYTGGFVEAGGGSDRRLIIDQTGTVITLHLPFTTSPLGTNVIVFAGCDHSISTCAAKFSNVINFGGFAWVPSKNIFSTGIRI
jgi:uncharacterized phage protein (TIGR02218 family)